jgi:hypothetical protein
MKTLIRLCLEWDYGQDYLVFNSEEDAFAYVETVIDVSNLKLWHIDSHQDVFDQGFAGYETITIWENPTK